MKKLYLILSLLALAFGFNSCSTDVDLYADYKDIPIIYGLLDASQDTNYVRINRAFSGNNDHPINANEVALIADSCNYPGKLKAYFVEYKNTYGTEYVPSGRDTMFLDTITIHNKQEGTFYAPNQKVYFTDKPFNVNDANVRYKYKLNVHRGNDTITSETGVVGGENFKILNSKVSFSSDPSDRRSKITFMPADNAVFYDVQMAFYYREERDGKITYKHVDKDFGVRSEETGLEYEDGHYYVSYPENLLFGLLEDAIGADTFNVSRYMGDFIIFIAAGGDELYNYIQVNSQTGFSQTVPDYTNITGGYGVLSSRINLQKTVLLSARAQSDILNKPWKFRPE